MSRRIYIVCLLYCVSLHALASDGSIYNEILERLITDHHSKGDALFIAGCEEAELKLIQIIPKNGQGLLIQLKGGEVDFLGEISYSTKAKMPLIEVDGGIEKSKYAYELYEMVKDQTFRILTIYNYDHITNEIKFGTCEN